MVKTSKQVKRDGALWGEKRRPSQVSKLKQTNDAIVQR